MIIGLSGRKQSGKDLTCRIIQYLIFNKQHSGGGWTFQEFLDIFDPLIHSSSPDWDDVSRWQRKLFADKLKDIVCLLINCTREQLEDNTFKETPLGEEWWKEVGMEGMFPQPYTVKLTPRLLLQLMGTECGRQIIHPNIWVNALMSEYKTEFKGNLESDILKLDAYVTPNWIITDVRFPNEAQAIKDRGGLIFRIEREGLVSTDIHASETSLDSYDDFSATIYNNSNIETLITNIKSVLTIFKII